LGKRVLTDLWEFWKERDFKSVIGAMGRARFLESNLFLFPTPFLSDFGGKGMGALSLCSFINYQRTNGFLRRSHESFDPLKSFVFIMNIV
jgi:hypothetical protein